MVPARARRSGEVFGGTATPCVSVQDAGAPSAIGSCSGRAAGLATELHVWPEAPHGFIALPMTVADAALSAEHEFLCRTLDLTSGLVGTT